MKLRSQMMLAAAMTLVVPLVGWQSVKQLYVTLQQTRIDDQTLKVANMRLSLAESLLVTRWLEPALQAELPDDWYAQTSAFPIFLDGYDDDWRTLRGPWYVYSANDDGEQGVRMVEQPHLEVDESTVEFEPWASTDNRLAFRVATYDGQLFLFIRVDDTALVYHRIPVLQPDAGEGELPDRWQRLVNGDAIEIAVEAADGRVEHGLFRAMAPGPVAAVTASDAQGVPAGQRLNDWQAYWTRIVGGYQLEVSLPMPRNAAFVGIAAIDVDDPGNAQRDWLGSVAPARMAMASAQSSGDLLAARVFHASSAIRRRLEGWTTEGVRARLFNARGWLVADVNKLYTTVENDLAEDEASSFNGVFDALLLRVFSLMVADDLPLLPERRSASVTFSLSEQRRSAVRNDQPLTSRYVTEENDRVLGTLAPLGQNPRRGYLLLEANEEHASAYAGSQLARLFSLLLLVSLLAGCGLLTFALILSARIRRLSREAQQAVSIDGRVSGLTESDARDEIGDLSRKLSSLLSRSAQYTQYLEALSGRLSHELRTPLSVVRTSLENLDPEALDDQSRVLVRRAEHGAAQLGRIIKALVDSTRLEQSVQAASRESVDLAVWLRATAAVYQQIHPEFRFVVRPSDLPALIVKISPELLQQAMDKLVDNAVSYSHGHTLVLQLKADYSLSRPRALLSVANKGPAIVEAESRQLFDPLVSRRANADTELHLGLGLYIVRLIAEGSGGEAFARNQDDWVVFGLSLPVT